MSKHSLHETFLFSDQFLECKEVEFAEIHTQIKDFLMNAAEYRNEVTREVNDGIHLVKVTSNLLVQDIKAICNTNQGNLDRFCQDFVLDKANSLATDIGQLKRNLEDMCNGFKNTVHQQKCVIVDEEGLTLPFIFAAERSV